MAIRNCYKSSAWRNGVPRVLAAIFAGCLLAACSTPEPEIPDTPVETLYNNGKDSLQIGETRKAAKLFDEVERQHPYSKWATQAQLMSAYSYYLVDSYDDAIPALERFNTEQAQRALSDVVARFPNTPYSRDATVKLDLVRDHLAGKEMDVGRYYLKRGQHLAAINRFKVVVDKFQTTSHVPEALERMTESYVALGVFAEAQKSTAVLGYNYPGSPWYQDAYNLLVSKGMTPEGNEAAPPIALVDPGAVAPAAPGATLTTPPAEQPAADAPSASDVAPAPDAVPVEPVTTTATPPAEAVPSDPTPSNGGDTPPLEGPALSTNSTDDMMAPDPGSGPSGDQFQIPLGNNAPAPQ
jgi:outer membrane protein assembly factor BamD